MHGLVVAELQTGRETPAPPSEQRVAGRRRRRAPTDDRTQAAGRAVHAFEPVSARLQRPAHAPCLIPEILELEAHFGVGAPRPEHHGHRETGSGEIPDEGNLGGFPGSYAVVAGHDLRAAGDGIGALEGNLGDRDRNFLHQRRVNEVPEVEDAGDAPRLGRVYRRVVIGDVVVNDLGAQAGEFRRHAALETLEGPLRELAARRVFYVPAEPRQPIGALEVPCQGMVRGGVKEPAQSAVETRGKRTDIPKQAGVAGRSVHRLPRDVAHHAYALPRPVFAFASRPLLSFKGAHHPRNGHRGVAGCDVLERRALEVELLVRLGRVGDLQQALPVPVSNDEVGVALAPQGSGPAPDPEHARRHLLCLLRTAIRPRRFEDPEQRPAIEVRQGLSLGSRSQGRPGRPGGKGEARERCAVEPRAGPHGLHGGDQDAPAAERRVAERNDSAVRLRMRGSRAQALREIALSSPLVYAGDDQGRRGRTADAGKAMHQHRRTPVPCGGKVRDAPHMPGIGQDGAGERLDDVVTANEEMILGKHPGGSHGVVGGSKQGEQMARPGCARVARHLLEVADVDIRHRMRIIARGRSGS